MRENTMAAMNLIEELDRSRFMLLLLEEEKYLDKISEIAKHTKAAEKICYVCLSKPYRDVFDDLRKKGVDTKKFYFIDVLSAHYEKKKPQENCIYLTSPNLLEIKFAVSKALKEKNCRTVIFDTISTMLIYQDASKIVRFTHDFLSEERERSKILYLVIKHESVPSGENEKLVDDLSMFADRTIKIK